MSAQGCKPRNELQQLKRLLEVMEKKGYHNIVEVMETDHFLVTSK